MNIFQLILLAIGGVILVWVYLVTRKTPKAPPARTFENETPSLLLAEHDSDVLETETHHTVSLSEASEPSLPVDEDESIDVDDLNIAALFEKTQAANTAVDSASNATISQADTTTQGISDAALRPTATAQVAAPPAPQPTSGGATQTAETSPDNQHDKQHVLPDNIVVLHIKPKQKDSFWGNTLLETLQDYQLQYGAMQVFHCHFQQQRIFSVVNMVEPGTFDLDKLPATRIKGLTAFMQLDKLQDVPAAFDHMIKTLGEIADILEASIFDRQHTILTNQSLDQLRRAVNHYER